MTQHPSSPPSAAPVTRARWTPDRQRLFLATLIATGNVSQAARTVGMSPASAHRLRNRLSDTPFDRAWAGALALHAQGLADPFRDPVAATLTDPAAMTRPAPRRRAGAALS
ncbi:hypothetical protein J3E64_000118 [Sphingobium sp. OAS761]|uniref:LysR family transcriptional regulator n=1 Tax=Sphingobium sp. OAS761 TaxID=2817901 RepID=UPI00209D8734|nr:LysR family transcriptional regulator [Sphingobium sp. OAS761]MCP1468451.1 hypothetical protein [Sphingobium sp. OAS761]